VKNRHLRIFISSTFRDMTQEREELVKYIFPKIRKIAKKRFVEVTEIDLRWGITQEQADSGETLKICLDEILKCKASPVFFLGMLGDRYGWIPEDEDPKIIADINYRWMSKYKDKSVVELEILCAVLNERPTDSSSYFYFRDANLSQEISSKLIPPLEYEPKEVKDKLQKLKENISSYESVSIDGYDTISSFGKQVFQDLLFELNRLYPEEENLTQLDKIRISHEQFSLSRKKLYYVKDQLLYNQVDAFINSTHSYLILNAESGLGKSSLIANYAEYFKKENPNTLIIEHYIGSAGDNSDVLSNLMLRILQEIDLKFNVDTANLTLENVEKEFLKKIASISNDANIVIFIDAVNQFEAEIARELLWLPNVLPTKFKIVISSTRRISKENSLEIVLKKFKEDQQLELINNYLTLYGKSISKQHINKILQQKNSKHPFYLKIFLEELKQFGVYEELDIEIDKLLQAQSIDDLLEVMLKRIDEELQSPNFKEVLSLLYVSRYGLSEIELFNIINEQSDGIAKLTKIELSVILLAIDEHIVDKNSLISFSHRHFNKAVNDYFINDEYEKSQREKLISFFEKQDDSRKYDEHPWQLFKLEDNIRLGQAVLMRLYVLELIVHEKGDMRRYLTWLNDIDNGVTTKLCARLWNPSLGYENYVLSEMLYLTGAHEDALNILIKNVKEEGEYLSDSLQLLVTLFTSLGKFEEANSALDALSKIFNDNAKIEEIAYVKIQKAILHRSRGENVEAIAIYKDVLTGSMNKTRIENYVQIQMNLGIAYRHNNQYLESEEVLRSGYNNIKSIDTGLEILILRSLATTLKYTKNLDEALSLMLQSYEKAKEFYGLKHPDTLTVQNNLAKIYEEKLELEIAREHLEAVLTAREETFKDQEHFETLLSRHNLAHINLLIYLQNDEKDQIELLKAYEYAMNAYVNRSELYGEEHFDTLISKALLFAILVYQESENASVYAESLFECRERFKNSMGEKILLYVTLILYYKDNEKILDILNSENGLTINKQKHSSFKFLKSNDLLTTMEKIQLLIDDDENDDALAMAIELLHTTANESRPEDTHAFVLNNLGLLFKNLKSYDNMILSYELATKMAQRLFGKNHIQSISFLSNLALAYENTADLEGAENSYKEAFILTNDEELDESFQETHRDRYKRFLDTAIEMAVSEDNFSLAHELSLKLYNFHIKTIGLHNPITLDMLRYVGIFSIKMGNPEQAIVEFELLIKQSEDSNEYRYSSGFYDAILGYIGAIMTLSDFQKALNIMQGYMSEAEEMISSSEFDIWKTQYQTLAQIITNTYGSDNASLQDLLHLAKFNAIVKESNEISVSDLFFALAFIELNPLAVKVFSQMSDLDMIQSRPNAQSSIEFAEIMPSIPYSDELQGLLVILENILSNKFIGRLR